MALEAMRFHGIPGRDGIPAQSILALGHRFEVCRVNAAPNAAEVVEM